MTPKPFDFELNDAGVHVKNPALENGVGVTSDIFELAVYGQTKSGRHVYVTARIDRQYIEAMAAGLWRVVDAEEIKLKRKRAAMTRGA